MPIELLVLDIVILFVSISPAIFLFGKLAEKSRNQRYDHEKLLHRFEEYIRSGQDVRDRLARIEGRLITVCEQLEKMNGK